jgi:peptidoglycan hydrolase-like protein with peptidoglycan-binding domain
MAFDDLGNIITDYGLIPKALWKSDGLSDEQMTDLSMYPKSYDIIAKIYREQTYLWLNANDIDQIGAISQLGKPITLGVKFGTGEWSKEVPDITQQSTPYAHGITILPRSTFRYNGKKAVLIQDSGGITSGIKGRRVVTEDWFLSRTFASIYFVNRSNLEILNNQLLTQSKPKYNFTLDLVVGQKNDEVAMLQRCLGYIKDADGYLFPLTQSPTGYFGGLTRSAVKRYQALKNIPQTGNVIQLTRAALNKDFA